MITGVQSRRSGTIPMLLAAAAVTRNGYTDQRTEPLELRVMENYVAAEDPEPVNIELTVNRSTLMSILMCTGISAKATELATPIFISICGAHCRQSHPCEQPESFKLGRPGDADCGLDTTSATGRLSFSMAMFYWVRRRLIMVKRYSILILWYGVHALRAEYQDEYFAPSTATVINQTVNKLPTILTLSGDPNPAAIGSAVNFTASVDPAEASGQVEFYDGETLIGTLNLADGSAVLTTDELTLGTHSIKAVYQGDEYYAAGIPMGGTGDYKVPTAYADQQPESIRVW